MPLPTIDLDTHALKKDLDAAQKAIGVKLEITEQKTLGDNDRRMHLERTYKAPLASGSKVRARFVKQGWAERAKKVFVKEVEIGVKSFDDAVYIATDTPDEVRALLKHHRAQSALVALVKKDAIIDAGEKELVVHIEDAHKDDGAEAAEVLALAACLQA
jgi:hypothetical protein